MVRHLLVTNDFPPKIGGIQNYLWELWRRLPADDVIVHTTPHDGAEAWDAAQDFTVVRSREPWLLPQPMLVRRVNQLAESYDAEVVIIDPAVPAGLSGPHLDRPYGVVLHGAEVTIPGRVPGTRRLLNRVLAGSAGVIAAGGYPAAEGERSLRAPLPPCPVSTSNASGLRPPPRRPPPGLASVSLPTARSSRRFLALCPARAWTRSSGRVSNCGPITPT